MFKKNAGFGLVEVLIASIILAVGLIGLASLQTKAIRVMQEGDNLVMASMIANEFAKRMVVNGFITKIGLPNPGYLYDDYINDSGNFATIPAWASYYAGIYPGMFRCYPNGGSITSANSCIAAGQNVNDGSQHYSGLVQSRNMDQYEMRQWAWASLPNGRIKLCFDTAAPYTSFSCNNATTRDSLRQESLFTIKVQWTNIFSNTSQMYALQFSMQCDNNYSGGCY